MKTKLSREEKLKRRREWIKTLPWKARMRWERRMDKQAMQGVFGIYAVGRLRKVSGNFEGGKK
jgi:hypothetical protein